MNVIRHSVQWLKNQLPAHVVGRLSSIRTFVLRTFSKNGLNKSQCSLPVKKLSLKNEHLYFGYYDISPFSRDEKFVLAIAAPLNNRSPEPNSRVHVGYFVLNEAKHSDFKVIGASTTWGWQQGSRLQWYPLSSSKHILYNQIVNGQYGAVIQDIGTGDVIKTFQRPLYAISHDGRWGLSLNFSRLQRLRPGYGYTTFPDPTFGHPAPDIDGIWLVDMQSGESRLIISLAQMASWAKKGREVPTGVEHYFNHLCFNPKGDRLLFFHIWTHRGKRTIQMITSDRNGENIYPLETSGMASHFSWISDQKLIAFAQGQEGLGYYLYTDQTIQKIKFAGNVLVEDGHPSYSPDGRYLLTDTYPDRFGNQHLLLLDNLTQRIERLGSFFRPYRYQGEFRCDLHPRWSPSGRYVAFDSAHNGTRGLYVLDLTPLHNG